MTGSAEDGLENHVEAKRIKFRSIGNFCEFPGKSCHAGKTGRGRFQQDAQMASKNQLNPVSQTGLN
jgi:hypothetical protein